MTSSYGHVFDTSRAKLNRLMDAITRLRSWYWVRIAERVVHGTARQKISFQAAAVAFYVVFALPAFFTALFALYGLAAEPRDLVSQLRHLEGLVPRRVIAILYEEGLQLVAAAPTSLGFGFLISVGIALWSGRVAMLSLIKAVNLSFAATETRSFFAVQAIALSMALFVVLFAVGASVLVVAVSILLAWIPLGPFSAAAVSLTQWTGLVVLEIALLGMTYRYAPANKARCGWFTPGAAVATMMWLLASAAFSAYVRLAASYASAVESLGGVLALMSWIYLTVFVVLLGAEINAAIAAERAQAEGEKS